MSYVYPVREGNQVRLIIYVRADEIAEGDYDLVEVWKSTLGRDGPFEELTATAYTPAETPYLPPLSSLPKGVNKNVVGLGVSLRVAGSVLLSYVFTGSDPLTPAQILGQLTTALSTHIEPRTSAGGEIVLRTVAVGRPALLEVLGGTALPALGMTTGSYRGKDPRIPITTNTAGDAELAFLDPVNVANQDIYRVRLRNSTDGTVSAWSSLIRADDVRALSPAHMIRVRTKLVTLEGRPKANTTITISYPDKIQLVEETTLLAGNSVRLVTDRNGEATCTLLRGVDVDILVDGTSMAQRIHTSADPEVLEMDLFDPTLAKDDGMAVQRPGLPFSARRL